MTSVNFMPTYLAFFLLQSGSRGSMYLRTSPYQAGLYLTIVLRSNSVHLDRHITNYSKCRDGQHDPSLLIIAERITGAHGLGYRLQIAVVCSGIAGPVDCLFVCSGPLGSAPGIGCC